MWRSMLLTSITGSPLAGDERNWDVDSLVVGDFKLGERGEAYLDGLSNIGHTPQGTITVHGYDALRFMKKFDRVASWHWVGQNIAGWFRFNAPETRLSVSLMYEATTQLPTWPANNRTVEVLRHVSLAYALAGTKLNSYGSNFVDVYETASPAAPDKPHSIQIDVANPLLADLWTRALSAVWRWMYPLFPPHELYCDNVHRYPYIPPATTNTPPPEASYFQGYETGYQRMIDYVQARVAPLIGNNPGTGGYHNLLHRVVEHATRTATTPAAMADLIRAYHAIGSSVILGAEYQDQWPVARWLETYAFADLDQAKTYLMTGRSGSSFTLFYPEGVVRI